MSTFDETIKIEHAIIRDFLNRKSPHLRSLYLDEIIPDNGSTDEFLPDFGSSAPQNVPELIYALFDLIPDETSETHGIVFTPSYICDFMVRRAAPSADDLAADLSCGGGQFIISLLEYYTKVLGLDIEKALGKIWGYDILEDNVRRCKLCVMVYALTEHSAIIRSEDVHVYCLDTLRTAWSRPKFGCIVGNPPYVRFQDMSQKDRDYIARNYRTGAKGNFNMFYSFFETGYEVLVPGGTLSYITPNNYFSVNSAKALRDFLIENGLEEVIDFGGIRVFDNAQAYTSITTMKKCSTAGTVSYMRAAGDARKFLEEVSAGKVHAQENLLAELRKSSKWEFRYGPETNLIEKIQRNGKTVAETFNMCAGIATLNNSLYMFVPDGEDENNYFLSDGRPIEKEATRKITKIAGIRSDADVDAVNRRIIFPYKTDMYGKATVIEEEEFMEKFPNCYAYFLSIKSELDKRENGTLKPFYKWGRYQSMNNHGIKILSKTFAAHPIFIIDRGIEDMFVNGYGIYMNGSCPLSREDNIDAARRVLESPVLDYYIRKTSTSISGGYLSYQKTYLGKFKIPEMTEDEVGKICEMSDEEFLKFIYSKYELDENEIKEIEISCHGEKQ